MFPLFCTRLRSTICALPRVGRDNVRTEGAGPLRGDSRRPNIKMAGLAFAANAVREQTRRVRRDAHPLALGHRDNRYLLQVALVVALYYAAAHIGFAFQFAGPVAAIVWLPVGVGIAALYVLGLRLWPGIVVGDLLVNNYTALPVGSAIGQSFGN